MKNSYLIKWSEEDEVWIARIKNSLLATHGDSPLKALQELLSLSENIKSDLQHVFNRGKQ